jgi:hypothetical protein
VIFVWVVTLVLLTPSDTKYALIAFARALASLLTRLSLTPGNFPAVPVTIKLASEPLLANAFLIAAFWSSLKTEEPTANVAEMLPSPLSFADATGLATSPARVITKLVIRIVTSVEILRMLDGSLANRSKKIKPHFLRTGLFRYMCIFRQIDALDQFHDPLWRCL